MICVACQQNVAFIHEISNEGLGVTQRCPRIECNATQPKVLPPLRAVPQPTHSVVAQQVEHAAVNRGDAGSTPADRANSPVNNTKPPNVVALAKQRRRFVKQQIRALRQFEKELAELDRLIAAAKPTKHTNVRALRAV